MQFDCCTTDTVGGGGLFYSSNQNSSHEFHETFECLSMASPPLVASFGDGPVSLNLIYTAALSQVDSLLDR
jgi:hypothetical protein